MIDIQYMIFSIKSRLSRVSVEFIQSKLFARDSHVVDILYILLYVLHYLNLSFNSSKELWICGMWTNWISYIFDHQRKISAAQNHVRQNIMGKIYLLKSLSGNCLQLLIRFIYLVKFSQIIVHGFTKMAKKDMV